MTDAAQIIADMANEAEAAILDAIPAEMRDWYLSLPREQRVEMAMVAAKETAVRLGA